MDKHLDLQQLLNLFKNLKTVKIKIYKEIILKLFQEKAKKL